MGDPNIVNDKPEKFDMVARDILAMNNVATFSTCM